MASGATVADPTATMDTGGPSVTPTRRSASEAVTPGGSSPHAKRISHREVAPEAVPAQDVSHIVLVQEVARLYAQAALDTKFFESTHDAINNHAGMIILLSSFSKQLKQLINAKKRAENLAAIIHVMENDERRCPAGVPPFKSGPEPELLRPFAASETADYELTIRIPAGSSRADALELLHCHHQLWQSWQHRYISSQYDSEQQLTHQKLYKLISDGVPD